MIAFEMVWPQMDLQKMKPKQIHKWLVDNWQVECGDFEIAKKYAYTALILEAGARARGIGCTIMESLDFSWDPHMTFEKRIEPRDRKIRENSQKIPGKVLAYCGTLHVKKFEGAAKVILYDKDAKILMPYFEPPGEMRSLRTFLNLSL